MTDRLDEAKQTLKRMAEAHQRALTEEHAAKEALAAARERRAAAGAAVVDTRGPLHDAIVAAARAGARQVDIADLSGYKRDRVYNICKAAGVNTGQ